MSSVIFQATISRLALFSLFIFYFILSSLYHVPPHCPVISLHETKSFRKEGRQVKERGSKHGGGGVWEWRRGLRDGMREKKIDKQRDNNGLNLLNQTESSPRVKPCRTENEDGKDGVWACSLTGSAIKYDRLMILKLAVVETPNPGPINPPRASTARPCAT